MKINRSYLYVNEHETALNKLFQTLLPHPPASQKNFCGTGTGAPRLFLPTCATATACWLLGDIQFRPFTWDVVSSLVPTLQKKSSSPHPCPRASRTAPRGKLGTVRRWRCPVPAAKTFLKARATELLERTPWWAQFVCSQDPPCPHSLFLPHCDAEDSTVKIIRVNSPFSIILWGKEPWIQNHKVGGV